jgi:hypothetical protein
MSRKILGFGLIVLLVGLGVVPILQANAQQQDRVRGEQFVQIAQRAKQHVLSIREMAVSKGVSTSKMDGLIAEGDALLKDAQTSLADNKLADAITKASLAMRKYTEAIKSLGETLRRDSKEVERENQEVAKREAERLQRVREILRSVPNAPPGLVREVNDRIVAAEVESKADAGKRGEAARAGAKTTPVHARTEQVLKAVREIQTWKNVERAKAYLESIEKQLKKTTDEIDRAANRGINVDALKKRLVDLQTLVESAKKKVAGGDIDGAMKDIKEVQRLMSSIQRDYAQAIRAQNGRGR